MGNSSSAADAVPTTERFRYTRKIGSALLRVYWREEMALALNSYGYTDHYKLPLRSCLKVCRSMAMYSPLTWNRSRAEALMGAMAGPDAEGMTFAEFEEFFVEFAGQGAMAKDNLTDSLQQRMGPQQNAEKWTMGGVFRKKAVEEKPKDEGAVAVPISSVRVAGVVLSVDCWASIFGKLERSYMGRLAEVCKLFRRIVYEHPPREWRVLKLVKLFQRPMVQLCKRDAYRSTNDLYIINPASLFPWGMRSMGEALGSSVTKLHVSWSAIATLHDWLEAFPKLAFLDVMGCNEITVEAYEEAAPLLKGLSHLRFRSCVKLERKALYTLADHCIALVSLELRYHGFLTAKELAEVVRRGTNISTLIARYCHGLKDFYTELVGVDGVEKRMRHLEVMPSVGSSEAHAADVRSLSALPFVLERFVVPDGVEMYVAVESLPQTPSEAIVRDTMAL